MYQLRCIGKLQMTENQAEILIHLPYRKALKSLEMFSHIHIFYIHKEDSRLQLNTCIVKIESVELKTGSIRISHLKHSLISTNGLIPKESVVNLREINDEEMSLDLDIVDIKPYFPCEDAVRKICRVNEKIKRPIVEKQKDSYEIYDIGMIRNTHGKIYIQLKDWIEIKSEYVKVLWWFNRYDEPKYRRAVECNPP